MQTGKGKEHFLSKKSGNKGGMNEDMNEVQDKTKYLNIIYNIKNLD